MHVSFWSRSFPPFVLNTREFVLRLVYYARHERFMSS